MVSCLQLADFVRVFYKKVASILADVVSTSEVNSVLVAQ